MRFAAMSLVAVLAANPLAAQSSVVVDEATFMVARNGAPIGRESFRIIRATGPGGQVYRAVATSAQDDIRFSSTLATDSANAPVSYELRVSQRGEQMEFLQGRGRPDRFSVLAQTQSGEAGAEYLVSRNAALLDADLVHQFYFVARAALASPDSSVMVISPREATQRVIRLEFMGAGPLSIGGRSLSSRHFALRAGSETRAEVWLDASGRLLKAAVPGQGLVALRDDPPR